MRSWLLRALVFAFLMVVLRLIQGAMINVWETHAGLISIFLVIIYFIVVIVWGYLDGRSDARAQPDPDRRSDLAMTWLIAGLIAGILSGAVCWFISLFYKSLYVGGLVNEVTTFAAFTALLVFIGAIIGFGLGRYLTDRQYDKEGVPRRAAGEENVDTDVFEAVREDEKTQEEPAK